MLAGAAWRRSAFPCGLQCESQFILDRWRAYHGVLVSLVQMDIGTISVASPSNSGRSAIGSSNRSREQD
jgi:hypothetical protein